MRIFDVTKKGGFYIIQMNFVGWTGSQGCLEWPAFSWNFGTVLAVSKQSPTNQQHSQLIIELLIIEEQPETSKLWINRVAWNQSTCVSCQERKIFWTNLRWEIDMDELSVCYLVWYQRYKQSILQDLPRIAMLLSPPEPESCHCKVSCQQLVLGPVTCARLSWPTRSSVSSYYPNLAPLKTTQHKTTEIIAQERNKLQQQLSVPRIWRQWALC